MAKDQQRETLKRLEGAAVLSSDGEKVGKIADVYFDTDTGRPEWGLVTTGMFGNRHSFVSLTTAQCGDEVRLDVTKEQVTGAPTVDDDGELSQEEEATLAAHYGLHYGDERSSTGLAGDPAPGETLGVARRPRELVQLRERPAPGAGGPPAV